jgi:cobalamin biosynthesis protein CobT
MEMKLANKESKSILAKLLASENLTVEHGKFSTASFDVKNRVLRLPIWKEMSGSPYDLLVLHEVGHALFTPEEGLHDVNKKKYGKGFKSFLNVVEDARIERKIKIKYPGGRRSFIKGYSDLMERDFFGLKKEETYNSESEKLNLIDKINLHYKVGDHMNLTFSDEESVFVDRIDKAQTWKDVVKICEDLYEYAKENESETDMSDHDWENEMCPAEDDSEDYDWNEDYDPSDYDEPDSEESEDEGSEGEDTEKDDCDAPVDSCEDGESGEDTEGEGKSGEEEGESTEGGASSGKEGGMDGKFEPESKTDRNFRNNETELVSEESKPYRYINLPNNVDLKKIIVNYSEIYEEYKKLYSGPEKTRYGHTTGDELMVAATEKFSDFRSKNKKVVEYLAKEFEMKKAAKEHSRAATANSGILDSERLYTYKYNEHIFKKLTITPDGKNHGLVMFVDWSGSMSRNMKGTIEQMMVLVMFCKRVNIPFEVYAFSDSYTKGENKNVDWVDSNGYVKGEKIRTYGTVAMNRFNLLNLFSSKMRARELHEAYIYMTASSNYWSDNYRYGAETHFDIPNEMHLGGTPLNSALFVSFSVMREFQKRNQVDVINSIFLTDGDSHSCNQYWIGEDETKHFDVREENVIIRDSVSK